MQCGDRFVLDTHVGPLGCTPEADTCQLYLHKEKALLDLVTSIPQLGRERPRGSRTTCQSHKIPPETLASLKPAL